MTTFRRRYRGAVVDAAGLAAACDAFQQECGSAGPGRWALQIDRRDDNWEFERVEDFLDEYERGPCRALLRVETGEDFLVFSNDWTHSEVAIHLATPSQVRGVVTRLEGRPSCPPFTVFIGHGRDHQWQALASHLRDRQGFHVVTYETFASYGQPATQVLDRAAQAASVALLVHTAELECVDGARHAVPNVVHETGFFSAHLGPDRALILREDSCRPFTNIAGVTELRFSDHNIREIFGDVVAALRQHSGEIPLPSSTDP